MTSSGPSPRKIKRIEEDSKGSGSSYNDNLPDNIDKATRQTLFELEKCQKERMKSNTLRFPGETKYNKLHKPCYDKRATFLDKFPEFWLTNLDFHLKVYFNMHVLGDEEVSRMICGLMLRGISL